MFTIKNYDSIQNWKRYLSEYQPQLEKALDSIKILKSYAPNSE